MEKVFEAEPLRGIKCVFYKMDNGNYLRVQEMPTATFEEEYTEEEYKDFLRKVELFNSISKDQKKEKK